MASRYLSPAPRDFTSADPDRLGRDKMIAVVKHGKAGTAMMSFAQQLADDDIAAVVDFVRESFMIRHDANGKYHTVENGWYEFDRYAVAFPFAEGRLAIDTPEEQLSETQRKGKHLFLSTCISCHEGLSRQQPRFEPRAVSYPRAAYSHREDDGRADAVSGATPYARHERAPEIRGLSEQQRHGERLFQHNCAFCHAADGTAKNWIGSFLQPSPRNLRNQRLMAGMTRQGLKKVIEEGLEGTTMPAWKDVLSEAQIEAVADYVARVFLGGEGK